MAETERFVDFEGGALPFSAEAEQSVLGAILIDPESILMVADTLKPAYFYLPQHKAIYEALANMYELNRTIDFVTLLEWLKEKKVYDEAGGKAYLSQLAQIVPSSANINLYADIVKERYITRSLIIASRETITEVGEGDTDAGMLIDHAEQRIYDIRQGRDVSGLTHIGAVIQDETYDRLTKLNNPETRSDYIGIPSGISDIDKVTTGLNKSDLIIVGARPGMGKTSFALNIARNVALKEKKKVCFFSLEMTRDQLAQRLLSSEASIKSEKLRTGELSADEWTRLAQAGEELSKANLYLDETSGITVPQIKAKVRRMKNVDLVIIDYLGLIQSSKRKENRVQEVSDITRNLKIMAKELKIPIMVCAQLNRGPEGKTGSKSHIPSLSDLRESGSIEQDADIVLFLYREDYYQSETNPAEEQREPRTQCIIAKNRHGETKTVDLHWDGQFTRFTSKDVFHNDTNGN